MVGHGGSMTARGSLRALFLATAVSVCLACAGVLDAVAPEPPVPAPEGAMTTGVNTSVQNGSSTTTIGYDTDAKAVDVFKHYKKALTDDGWSMSSERSGGVGVLKATRDDETFVVTIEEGSFETVWTVP
jgi:hypothetical protein